MQPDKNQAKKFLRALDADASAFTFQTFDDNSARKSPELVRVMHGDLDACWPELSRLNVAGAGVFVTVQRTDGRGRKAENIAGIRAVFHEDDGAGFIGTAEPPHIEVESSPGKFHRYWLVDGLSADDFRGVMARMVTAHGSDPRAKDAARVLRLPGTLHNKGEPWLVRLVSAKRALLGPLPADELKAAFPPVEIPAATPTEPHEFDAAAVMRALSYIPADDRETWLSVGMALHHATGGDADGRALWDIWSRTETRGVYSDDMQSSTWAAFKSDRASTVTLGTVFHLAGAHGYTAIDPAAGFSVVTPLAESHGNLLRLPRDVSLTEIIASLERDLVCGILPHGEEAVIYGDPGAGKTFVALDLGWHVALGRDWHGRKTTKHPTLYVALEGVTGFEMRMLAAAQTFGDPGTWFARLNIPISLVRDKRGEEGMALIREACRQLEALCGQRVGLIILDTLARAIAGDDENAQDAMSAFVQDRMSKLRHDTGATVLVVHHTNKGGSMRGSSVLTGAANTILRCERDKAAPATRNLIAEKVKDGADGPLFCYRLEAVTLGARSDMTPVTSCVVTETAAVDTRAEFGRALLPLVTGITSIERAALLLAESPMHAGESERSIARKIIAVFEQGPITVDGVTLIFQPRGERGGNIVRATHN